MTADSNYRVIHRMVPVYMEGFRAEHCYEDIYEIHEVFYADDGQPVIYREDEDVYFVARSLTQLRERFNRYAAALGQPVLQTSDFIGGGENEHADHDA